MINLAQKPTAEDFKNVADHISVATQDALHPSLMIQRDQVTLRLRQMAEDPEKEKNRRAYHALRFLIW